MKIKPIFILSIFFMLLAFSLCLSANDRFIAEGKGGENVTWKLYDKNAENANAPDYYLVFSGSGNIIGYTASGGSLGYGNRNDSQFSQWEKYIYSVIVEDGITGVDGAGLAFLDELRWVELPSSFTHVGSAAFESDNKLERISVRGNPTFLGADLSNITHISTYSFDGCASLRYLLLNPDMTGEFQTEAFKGMGKLKSVTIPAGITALKGDVFENCSGLESIVFAGDPKISDTLLTGVSKKDIKIYGSVAGGNVRNFASAKGYEFINSVPDIPSDFYDPSAIDIGKCGTEESELYYKILPEGEGYTLYTFGSGRTMCAVSISDISVGYSTNNKVYWYPHRNLINKIVISEGVTTLTGISCGFLPNLKLVEIPSSLNAITGACFEGSSSFGSLYIKGNEPIEGHIDLTSIKTLGSYTFDGCRGIKTAEFAEYPTSLSLGTEFFKNCENLESVKLPLNLKTINANAFLNCKKLTTITVYSDASINDAAFSGCTSLRSIAGLRNSQVEAFALRNGYEFILPNVISVIVDGEKFGEADVVDGGVFYQQAVNDSLLLFYEDPELSLPFDHSTKIYDNMTLYAVPLIFHEGFMVRTQGYNGLRSVYRIDMEALKGNSLYSVTELGAIASFERGLRETKAFKHDAAGVFKSIAARNDTLTGKLASYPEGSSAQFAFTATGYDKNGRIDIKNATEPLYFIGYAILTNRETGEEICIYTSMKEATLKEKAATTLTQGEAQLTSEEKLFLGSAASAEYDRTALYTKEELMAYMNEMYADIDHVLFGQHISPSSPDTFANTLSDIKNKTGEYPAVVSFDQGTLNGAHLSEEGMAIFRTDLLEYARRGGIISISFHMNNPKDASLGYRGTLGTGKDFDDLMTKGSETNTVLMEALATAADTLQFLEDAGVPVLWRPLHEMNGGWFWWCTVQSGKRLDSSYFIRLWKYFYNYFEVECDLDNLIWVYSPNYSNNVSNESGTQDVMYCYPGDNYVDIVGCDWYTTTGKASDLVGAGNSYPKLIATGKPACITEFGPSGDLLPVDGGEHPFSTLDQLELMHDLRDMGHSMIYILNWSGHWGIASMRDPAAYTADPMIYGASSSYEGLIGYRLH